MFEIYVDGFQALRAYPEFMSIFTLLRYMLLALTGGLVVLAVLHVMFMLGYNSPLYRRKSPRLGWSKKLLPALAVFFAVAVGLYWLSGRLIA